MVEVIRMVGVVEVIRVVGVVKIFRPDRASFINCAKLICIDASHIRTCQLLLGLTDAIFESLKLLFRK